MIFSTYPRLISFFYCRPRFLRPAVLRSPFQVFTHESLPILACFSPVRAFFHPSTSSKFLEVGFLLCLEVISRKSNVFQSLSLALLSESPIATARLPLHFFVKYPLPSFFAWIIVFIRQYYDGWTFYNLITVHWLSKSHVILSLSLSIPLRIRFANRRPLLLFGMH